MPRRSNTNISFLIVMLSMVTILVQFIAYYFIASPYIIIGLSSIVSILSTHILLNKSLSYETDFIYSFLTLFVSLIVTLLTYYSKDQSIIPYSSLLFAIVFINWFVPNLHCFIRNMIDTSSRIGGYQSFYRNNSIVFILFYIGIIIYGFVFPEDIQWFYPTPFISFQGNLLPFNILSTQIELYIYNQLPLSEILIYLISRVAFYGPYGFYITLISRKRSRVVRFLLYLLFPIVIETIQYIYSPSYFDIDDIIFGLMGSILGGLLFQLKNHIYRMFSGQDFLAVNRGYRNLNRPLHF